MTKLRGVWVVVTAAVLAASCSGNGNDDGEGGDAAGGPSGETPAAEAEPVASPGCDREPAAAPGQTNETLESQGTQRTYRQFVPSSYDGTTPSPLVLNIHGLGSNGEQQAAFTGMEELAEEEGFLAIHPQGEGSLPLWNYISDDRATNDVGFITELVDALGERLCIDTSRVYATGMSNGGLMSSTLVCRLPDQIAAASAVAGLAFLDGCEDGEPVPLQVIYGSDDDILPYDGGLGEPIRRLFDTGPVVEGATVEEQQSAVDSIRFPPVDDSMTAWAARDGCEPEFTEEEVSAEVSLRTWEGCDAGAELRLFVVQGGGHTWPGSPLLTSGVQPEERGVLGHTTDDIDATELAWEFFQQHALQ